MRIGKNLLTIIKRVVDMRREGPVRSLKTLWYRIC